MQYLPISLKVVGLGLIQQLKDSHFFQEEPGW